MADHDKFWVGIRGPISMRKALLLSNKAVLDSLRRYEAFRELRRQKLEAIVGLKHILDELTVLNRRLRGVMPKVPMHKPTMAPHDEDMVAAEESDEAPAKEDKKGKGKKEAKKTRTKMDLLEEEIRKIEEKLGTLE